MSARDTKRSDGGFENPLYPHLQGNFSLDKNNHKVMEWRDDHGKLIYTSELMDLVDAIEESSHERGEDPYANPEMASALRELTRVIEELETLPSSGSPER